MQISQHPNIGPFYGLQATANCIWFNWNLYLMSKENMKDVKDLSAAQCFLEEFHGKSVKPPMILLYSVLTSKIVFGILSHFLWNSATEN